MLIKINFTNEPIQVQNIPFTDDENIELKFEYNSLIKRWFINIKYKTAEFKNLKLLANENLLASYENLIPFKISCEPVSPANINPQNQDDLLEGNEKFIVTIFD